MRVMARAEDHLRQERAVAPVRRGTPGRGEIESWLAAPPDFDRERQLVYLEQLSRVPNEALAALKAGVLPSQVKAHAERDERFAQACVAAKMVASGFAEAEAWRRAIDGVDVPVYYQGAKIDTKTEYSDQLLVKVLEANEPRYERKTKIDGDLNVNHSWLDMLRLAKQDVAGVAIEVTPVASAESSKNSL